MDVIRVEGLRKTYGDVEAVRGISFHVEEGEVLAVLGPNGAGKTTTIEILEGYRARTAGTVEVLGMDPAEGGAELRNRIGIVLQESGFDHYLTVTEMVRSHAECYQAPRAVDEVVRLVGLEEKARARVRTLSGGQRRRLDLALGLIGDPQLLFLDEPTTGFDPGARRQAWTVVRDLCALGKTVLLTTHYMDEAQQLADRVVVMAGGEIVASGTPESIGGRATAAVRIRFLVPDGVPLAKIPGADGATIDDGYVVIETATPTATLHRLAGWAVRRKVELEGLSVDRPSLEDVYLELTEDAATAASA
jgi:ABC-2 type transport system ATP-binding protein